MIPLIVNSPESMVKVRVMTMKDYSEPALKTLHRIGVLHVEEGKELKPVDKAALESERKEVSELLTFVDSVLSYIPKKERVPLGEDVEVIYTRPFSEISGEVRLLYDKINKLNERAVKLNDEAQQLTELKKYLEALAGQIDLRLRDLNFSGDYLFSRLFVLPSEAYETLSTRLKNYLFEDVVASVENETVFYVVARVKDQKIIESIVSDAGGKILPIPDEDLTLRDFLEIANGKILSLEEELTKLREELQSKAREDLNRIALLREALAAENERLSVLEKACEAKYITLIEGWIPENNIESAISEVKQSIDYVFIDTRKPEEEEEPPIKLKNPKGFKPFQVVVNLFATPKYREWDPTPIIAYSFAIFFGLMMADVVYAIGVILMARFLVARFLGDPQSEGIKLFKSLLYISGGVALVLGLLSGSYLGNIYEFFGLESVAIVKGIEQLFQDPLQFIIIALIIGLIHVNIGHLLALIKGVKERNRGIIVNKIGLFLVQLGIPFLLNFLRLEYLLYTTLPLDLPTFTEQIYTISLYGMLIGVIFVIAGSIMQSGGLGFILWIFDLTGILGDVMSYCRLAGVGLATFYLGASFNMLAQVFSEIFPGTFGLILGSIVAIVILVAGHMINLSLGAITGVIHSLRLCFVEFLFKFYEGGGRRYSPFKLKKRISAPVTT